MATGQATMFWVLLCIALGNVTLGYFIGSLLTRPLNPSLGVVAAIAAWEDSTAPLPADSDHSDSYSVSQQTPAISDAATLATTASAKSTAAPNPNKKWQSSCTDIRQDINTLYDRIRYAYTANDKQLAKIIATELQTRIPLWQKLLQDQLTAVSAELERQPTAKIDSAPTELCLAQTETLQTNLAILDWTDSTELILKKLEREVEAVKHLLPPAR